MQQLILVVILIITLSFAKEHYNPNGHPGTINIKWNYSTYIIHDGKNETIGHYELSIPINNWITLISEVGGDSYERTFMIDGTLDRDFRYSTFIHYGAELHIPLYKLWD